VQPSIRPQPPIRPPPPRPHTPESPILHPDSLPDSPVMLPDSSPPASPVPVDDPPADLRWGTRRDRPAAANPPPRKRLATAPPRPLADRTKPLSGQHFFIFQFKLDDIDDGECDAKNIVLSRMSMYPRLIRNVTLMIETMGGVVDDQHQSGNPVVIHLPVWDLTAYHGGIYQTLLHSRYFMDLEEAVESNSGAMPSIETYTFSRTGPGEYNDGLRNPAAPTWFKI